MLEERLSEMREELGSFDDEFTKYSFLVELSAYVKADQSDLMRDEYLQRGCQSRVWVRHEERNGTYQLHATSDTLIIRSILYIIGQLYNGVGVQEIAASNIDVLAALDIAGHFSDTRQLGIRSIADGIVSFCRSCAEKV